MRLSTRLRYRFFPPRETREILHAARAFFLHMTGRQRFRELPDRVMRACRNPAARSMMIVDGLASTAVVPLIVSRIAASMLEEGRMHSYRGTLTTEGAECLHAFEAAQYALVRLGIVTDAEAAESRRQLDEAIRNAG